MAGNAPWVRNAGATLEYTPREGNGYRAPRQPLRFGQDKSGECLTENVDFRNHPDILIAFALEFDLDHIIDHKSEPLTVPESLAANSDGDCP